MPKKPYLGLRLSLALLAFSGLQSAGAAAVKVDDSGSLVSQSVLPLRWSQPVPNRSHDNSAQGSLQVALRLDLSPWLNRPVRLYMALPASTHEPIQASWTSQGRLLPGELRSGGRALVFNAVVRSKQLEESLFLTLKADGRKLPPSQTLQFYFEIETP
jgi:hypothetical protein